MLQFPGRQEMTEMEQSGIEVIPWIRSNPRPAKVFQLGFRAKIKM